MPLRTLNISDCNTGQSNVEKVVAKLVAGLTEFYCNYNEVDEAQTALDVLARLANLGTLKHVSFVGNVESVKFNTTVLEAFKAQDVEYVF